MAPDNNSTEHALASPGALLRQKRTENNWSVAEVAQALCLSSWQLEALENDDYASLPGETYVLGYWRSYASLLGIPIGDFVAARKKYQGGTLSGIATEPQSRWTRTRAKPSSHLLGFLFALLSVVFLLSIWYWQSPPPESLLGQGDWHTGETLLPSDAVSDAVSDAAPELAEADAWNGEFIPENAATFAPLPKARIALPEPNFAEQNDPSPARHDDLREVTLAALDPQSVAAAARQAAAGEIAFAVDEESWLEVHDDAGKRLIYRNVAGGRRLTLAGTPPFKVFIGNAAGVTVHYRGAPVAFAAGNGGLFARFKVGAQ